MKHHHLVYVLLAAASSLASAEAPQEWIPLFNGKSLAGWHVACVEQDQGKAFWKVVEGTIECDSMGRPDHDYVWLCTDEEYADFELKLKFQAFRHSQGNSGVQIRSRYDRSSDESNGGWLNGPQVDIHPLGPWRTGILYDETRGSRGWINTGRPSNVIKREHGPEKVVFKYAEEGDGWNELTITCAGTRITTVVNGTVVNDRDFAGLLDDAVHKKYDVGMNGHIALQLHRKNELKIRFKDIYIKILE